MFILLVREGNLAKVTGTVLRIEYGFYRSVILLHGQARKSRDHKGVNEISAERLIIEPL
jgi:hypothetical protein